MAPTNARAAARRQLELACSGLDRGDAALLDAIAGLRVVDDPVPLDVDGRRARARAALGNTARRHAGECGDTLRKAARQAGSRRKKDGTK